MKKNQCKEGLDIYKKFLTRMTRISEFLKVAEVSCLLFICMDFDEIIIQMKEILKYSCIFYLYLVVVICTFEFC